MGGTTFGFSFFTSSSARISDSQFNFDIMLGGPACPLLSALITQGVSVGKGSKAPLLACYKGPTVFSLATYTFDTLVGARPRAFAQWGLRATTSRDLYGLLR